MFTQTQGKLHRLVFIWKTLQFCEDFGFVFGMVVGFLAFFEISEQYVQPITDIAALVLGRILLLDCTSIKQQHSGDHD